MNYVEAALYESQGPGGSLGVKILVALDHPITEAERAIIGHQCDELHVKLKKEARRADPKAKEAGDLMVGRLIDCFSTNRIYFERVENEYDGDPHRPWLVVTTFCGRIIIGWRSRVIQIDWSGSDVAIPADVLFYDQDVTKGSRMIHAWGYEKAKEYLTKILGRREQ